MNNKTYDILKWVAMYLLPAAGTLYFALAGIWGLPYGEEVVGTITAIDTFLVQRLAPFCPHIHFTSRIFKLIQKHSASTQDLRTRKVGRFGKMILYKHGVKEVMQ